MGEKGRRSRCPKCGSLDAIKRGTQCDCQRFKCKDCGIGFTPNRPDVSLSNRFVWFRKWISGMQRIEDIARESGYSSRQLRRWFDEYLEEYPTWSINTIRPIYLLTEGTFYSDNHCLVVCRAASVLEQNAFRSFRKTPSCICPRAGVILPSGRRVSAPMQVCIFLPAKHRNRYPALYRLLRAS